MREPVEHDYFDRAVRPLLEDSDELIVEPALEQRLDLLRHADALLNPICWPEPFGLVMIEALASGTPVLAFPHGAAPEIVDDGRTGYLCADEDDMVKAIESIPRLNRADCRDEARARFSLARMASEHARFYARLVAKARAGDNRPAGSGPSYLMAGPTAGLACGRR